MYGDLCPFSAENVRFLQNGLFCEMKKCKSKIDSLRGKEVELCNMNRNLQFMKCRKQTHRI